MQGAMNKKIESNYRINWYINMHEKLRLILAFDPSLFTLFDPNLFTLYLTLEFKQ